MNSVPIVAFEEIDSTNAEARRRGDAGEVGPVWITAASQTAGRGRRGRVWETGNGNLAATFFYATDQSPAEISQLAFVAALAVCDVVDAFVADAPVTVKWPNDILVDGRKTAGILIETSAHSGGGLWVAVGIGVNIASPPEEASYPATALAEHMSGPAPAPLEALDRLTQSFDRWRRIWLTHGFPAISRAWTVRAHGLGAACTARLPNETVEGIAEGLEADGALRLRVAGGQIRRITAGDVFFGQS